MALIFLATVAVPAGATVAAPGGRLDTLPQGQYRCALPGDAAGAAWIPLEDRNFTIGNGSTYRTHQGSGTYLLTGTQVTFTRGPMKGLKFERTGSGTLRWIDDNGEPGRVRCVRSGFAR
ncbi:hypothetical protein [Allopontixanthobacter sp.]|uniref:hypothetical protein n=1 Tax=Allopontixanthobacter sp. TaxID=2906452 RepID=UPI002ABB43CE|nr:hypothetical protein [Allopontixanthobacter sp.]MDZ4306521.1 hypothetical protein [Allopontixanthobacter sp.]